MSVLIRGMKMPDSCHVCVAGYGGCCFVAPAESDGICPDHGRADWCPLIEINPHGRLIDASEITEHKYTTIPSHRKEYADGKPKSDEEIIAFKFGWNYAIDAIVENAPTIIPADVPDNNVGNIPAEEGE